MLGEPLELVNNAGMASSFGTHNVAPVMVWGGTNIPGFNGVVVPGITGARLRMGMDFDARRGYRVTIEIKMAVDGFPAESCGAILEPQSRFSASSACGIVLSHRYTGKLWSTAHHPAAKWFFAVLIARSAALLQ